MALCILALGILDLGILGWNRFLLVNEPRKNKFSFLQIHFVFLDADLESLENVTSYGDLAVWGFFIEVSRSFALLAHYCKNFCSVLNLFQIASENYVKQGSFADILDKIASSLTAYGNYSFKILIYHVRGCFCVISSNGYSPR